MGTYSVSGEELKEKLQEFLFSIEGEVYADSLADAWNALANDNDWEDRLMTYRVGIKGAFVKRQSINKET